MSKPLHPPVLIAATALNAVVLAADQAAPLTLSPEDALALIPLLIEQTIQTLHLSGRKLTPSKILHLAENIQNATHALETLGLVAAPADARLSRAGMPARLIIPPPYGGPQ